MFLTSRFLWLNLLLKNAFMKKRITWLLSIAITVVVFIGAGYIALLHSRTQVHTYQSIPAGSRTPSLQRPSECVQQEPAHLRRPGPESLSFRARLQPENQKLYAPDYRRENHLPVQGQHPGRESPETAERIPAGRHTACQGGGSEPVVSGTARTKACQRNGGCVLF